MRIRGWTTAAALAVLYVGAAAAQAAPESAVEAFRRLRAEGVAALNAGELSTARMRLREADRRVPNHPGLTLLRAKLEAVREDLPASIALLDRYARFGLTSDVSSDEVLQRVSVENDFAPVARRLSANAQPIGRLEVLGQIEGAYLAEGVVRDAARDRWLISGVHGRTIMAVGRGGRLTRFLQPDAVVDGVMGLAVDAARNVLWAASSGLPQAKELPAERQGRAALLKIDLRTGRLLQRFEAPASDRPRAFGDVALGPDGAVYVSDSLAGAVFRLTPGGGALEVLVAAGGLGSPQGLVVTPDGRRLIVADYTAGLQVVDLASGATSALPVPPDASLAGADGLVREGDGLIAVQNGVTPQRVVRLEMDASFSRAEQWAVLAANLPGLQEPTSGVIHDGDLVFIARSQWSDFNDDGALIRDPPGPAILARLELR